MSFFGTHIPHIKKMNIFHHEKVILSLTKLKPQKCYYSEKTTNKTRIYVDNFPIPLSLRKTLSPSVAGQNKGARVTFLSVIGYGIFAVVDLRNVILDAQPPPVRIPAPGPNFFIFMQFSANLAQIIGQRPMSGWRPRKILDPPLIWQIKLASIRFIRVFREISTFYFLQIQVQMWMESHLGLLHRRRKILYIIQYSDSTQSNCPI